MHASLAQAAVQPEARKAAVREWAMLSMGIVLIALFTVLAAMVLRSRFFKNAEKKRKRASSRQSAWELAGKRAPIPPDDIDPGSNDDTVDLDPPPSGPGRPRGGR